MSALVEKEALVKNYKEAEVGFKELHQDAKARDPKLADCDSELEKVENKQVIEHRRLEALQGEVP